MAVLSGFKWPNPNVTVSIMPDGTKIDSFASGLQAAYGDALKAILVTVLSQWQSVSQLRFTIVPDSGLPRGFFGTSQGDPRFGDIRIGGYPSTSFWLGVTAYPSVWSTRGGDIILNTSRVTPAKLWPVLLHELGHAIGLGHSKVPEAVMALPPERTVLHADDIEGVQQIYGGAMLAMRDFCELDEIPHLAVKCKECEA